MGPIPNRSVVFILIIFFPARQSGGLITLKMPKRTNIIILKAQFYKMIELGVSLLGASVQKKLNRRMSPRIFMARILHFSRPKPHQLGVSGQDL